MPSFIRAQPLLRAARPACWLGLLSAFAAFAQPAPGLSFERALQLAAERAPMLAARQAGVDAAEQLRISAAELPDPRLTVGIDNLPIGGPERFTIGREPMTQRSIGWMQDVPNAAKRAARAAGAQARSERERALLAAERLAVRREVALAWLARWSAEQQLQRFAVLETENRLLQDTLAARLTAGRAAPADTTMARQEALALADRRDDLRRELAMALATLGRWLGADAASPLAGEAPSLPVDVKAVHAGVERHADLLAFDPLLSMTRAEVQEAEAGKRGDWNWQVGYGKRGAGFGDMVSVQFSFELPLSTSTRQQPQVAAKLKEAERIGAEREDAVRRRREEMDQQLAELSEVASKRSRLTQAALPLAEERVALAMAAYESARGDLAAVLGARRERVELALRSIELQGRELALRARLNYLVEESR